MDSYQSNLCVYQSQRLSNQRQHHLLGSKGRAQRRRQTKQQNSVQNQIYEKHRLVLTNTPLTNTYECSFKCYTMSVFIKRIWFRPLGVNLLLLCNIVVLIRTLLDLYLLTTCGTLIRTPTSIMKSA